MSKLRARVCWEQAGTTANLFSPRKFVAAGSVSERALPLVHLSALKPSRVVSLRVRNARARACVPLCALICSLGILGGGGIKQGVYPVRPALCPWFVLGLSRFSEDFPIDFQKKPHVK